jgi:hypothetical protein
MNPNPTQIHRFPKKISRCFQKRKGRGDLKDHLPSINSAGDGKERRNWKAAAHGSGRVSAGSGGARRKTALTSGTHLSATEREKRAAARLRAADWAVWADWAGEGERRREVLGRLSAQSQKRLLKTFFNLNYS